LDKIFAVDPISIKEACKTLFSLPVVKHFHKKMFHSREGYFHTGGISSLPLLLVYVIYCSHLIRKVLAGSGIMNVDMIKQHTEFQTLVKE
jgi:hypothetical protein